VREAAGALGVLHARLEISPMCDRRAEHCRAFSLGIGVIPAVAELRTT
jgi:hypothetical protein